jgi:hypothetical protein
MPSEVEGPPPPPARAVTIEPVVIEGDAGSRHLVEQHDCSSKAASAVEGTLPMLVDVAGTLAAVAAGPVAVGLGLAKLFHDSFTEGQSLRDVYNCKTQ